MSLLRRILKRVMPVLARQSAPLAVALKVTDDAGRVLVDVADAQRGDYRLSVSLPSGEVVVDLYGHYQRFVDNGAKQAYRGMDAACNTYVKFGECIQDKCELHVLIQPCIRREST